MAKNFTPLVIIVSSPSGAGKTSIVNKALNSLPNVRRAITHTTRKTRNGEQNGVDYHFVTKKKFEQMIKNNEFLEFAEVYGYLYGTSISEVKRIFSQGLHCILVIDVQGGESIRKNNPYKYYSIFFKSPSKKVIIQRLRDRGTEDKQSLNYRISEYEKELKHADYYDKIIVNDSIDNAVAKFIDTVNKIA